MPARSSSLFFAGRVSLAARCLRSSSTTYSALGMVKLSRTNFGFLVFSGFVALTGLVGLAVAWGLAAGFLMPAFFTMAFLTVPLPAGVLAGDAFFGAGLAAVFTGALGAV